MIRSRPIIFSALLVSALALGFFAARLTEGDAPATATGEGGTKDRKIAYWVGPMDPNYRRDAPGKSPMGMDLIPVYEGEEPGSADGQPALQINPAVVNNIGVRTELVRRTDLARRIETVGNVTVDKEKRTDIHVRSEGWIEKLAVEAEGESVERGDLLFQIYSPKLVAAQSEYLQVVRLGRAALKAAAAERLSALGMTSRQIDAVRISGKTTRLVDIYAPQSGIVTALTAREGTFVRPGDTALSLADLSTVWVIAEVFEIDANRVARGQKAFITLPSEQGEVREGIVDFVYPTVETNIRTVQVRLRFPNSDSRLKPNMYADVVIEAAPKKSVLTIPQSALIRASTGDRVILALGEGRFRPARVVAGMESGNDIEILSGLEAGERIVTSSQFLIDSEASLDPALLRLTSSTEPDKTSMPDMAAVETPEESKAVTGMGRVMSLDAAERRVVLDHQAIPELGWPAMTMAFPLAKDVPLEAVEEGASIHFNLRKTESGYEVLNVRPMTEDVSGGDGQ
ncbi:MAG: efflux transporter periplasmic adaptor subunit [Alphaproteobacteria bacterium HGW-Alphaproteobacteria-5]|nr:MAG: efflux transporter periplasmic adaptor subunit [Alphaproteobacteria bacterium HGW-Alphaproteobacteria-5]